ELRALHDRRRQTERADDRRSGERALAVDRALGRERLVRTRFAVRPECLEREADVIEARVAARAGRVRPVERVAIFLATAAARRRRRVVDVHARRRRADRAAEKALADPT